MLNIITSYAISKYVEQIFCQIVGCSKCIFAAVTPNFLARFPNWHSHFAEFHACLDSTTISGAGIQGVCKIFRALFRTVYCLWLHILSQFPKFPMSQTLQYIKWKSFCRVCGRIRVAANKKKYDYFLVSPYQNFLISYILTFATCNKYKNM